MITIVIGTNRKASVSSEVARYYQQMLRERGQDSQILDLAELPEDFLFSALYECSGKNAQFNRYRAMMKNSEKFVFVVPEYNGSFPGVLKAFIDGLEFPDTFKNKICALVGVSSGIQGAGPAINHLTEIFNYFSMDVLALKPKLLRINENWAGGKPSNDRYKRMLEDQADRIIHSRAYLSAPVL